MLLFLVSHAWSESQLKKKNNLYDITKIFNRYFAAIAETTKQQQQQQNNKTITYSQKQFSDFQMKVLVYAIFLQIADKKK